MPLTLLSRAAPSMSQSSRSSHRLPLLPMRACCALSSSSHPPPLATSRSAYNCTLRTQCFSQVCLPLLSPAPLSPLLHSDSCPCPSATGANFISNPSYKLSCSSQRCKWQCGVHNDSSVLLIPGDSCVGPHRLRLSLRMAQSTAVEALRDVLVVSGNGDAAPGCAGAAQAVPPSFSSCCLNILSRAF
jgi:hypothetical protein